MYNCFDGLCLSKCVSRMLAQASLRLGCELVGLIRGIVF